MGSDADDEAKYGMTSQEFDAVANAAMPKITAILEEGFGSARASFAFKTITLIGLLFSIFIQLHGKANATAKLHEAIDTFDKKSTMTKQFRQ